MLDHFIARNATAHKVHSYCVEKHTILNPATLIPELAALLSDRCCRSSHEH